MYMCEVFLNEHEVWLQAKAVHTWGFRSDTSLITVRDPVVPCSAVARPVSRWASHCGGRNGPTSALALNQMNPAHTLPP
jgi:hypothetical protein